ncbi:iron ABC transporter permease [Shewanella sp. Isolate11]|uniref:FecCD family ABC transporter permease n=1 Tax=Shewanella sp. Isolate11 TaxID=2908530 RepID=UPI001EFEBFA2|nr:iron ABC transporter permease [Shewanella sp. Isolate11]MCG9697601.1 iron ABC transporter permease [Shewanella sp. Isolate11]
MTLAVILLCLFTPLLAASFGAADISFKQVVDVLLSHIVSRPESAQSDNSYVVSRIVLELRMPRIILAFVAGFGLAIAGVVLQTVTRNPLADPYLFGISSGASFGAVVVLTLFSGVGLSSGLNDGISSGLGSGLGAGLSGSAVSLPIGAFIGASLSVLLVLALCGRSMSTQIERMLLSGVAVSFMFGALTSLLLYFSGPEAAASVLFWSLGSFAKASWAGLTIPLLIILLSTLTILLFKRQIIAMKAGDETAHTLGIKVQALRLGMLLLCSLITAVIVAHCGGIGFVGLMIPHMVRLLLPGRFCLLITGLVGGLFMIWVDVLARCLLSYQELPIGIITAVIGSVFFLFILAAKRRR